MNISYCQELIHVIHIKSHIEMQVTDIDVDAAITGITWHFAAYIWKNFV